MRTEEPAGAQADAGIDPKLLGIMSFAVGATVATIYYNQPLLEQMREAYGASLSQIGWIPSLTQAGYACGMLFIVPVGDMWERRRLTVISTLLSAICCLGLGFCQTLGFALLASFLLGLCTMTPQLLIPFAASMAKPEHKGRVVGTLMSGLLLGVLLARTVSGFVGSAYGFRTLFMGAGIFLIFLASALFFVLPKSAPSYHGSYKGLLNSVIEIFRAEPVLREASLFGALLFGSFSIFWATLIHLLELPQFGLGAKAVGLFGLLGAIAALLTPAIGSLADRKDPRTTCFFMVCLTLISFVVYGFSAHSLIGIGIGVLLMDIGVQAGHVSNQSRIFGLVPGAQSRIQTAYMFFYFVGGASGSLIGSLSFSRFGWTGVCVSAMVLMGMALLKFLSPAPQPNPRKPVVSSS